MDFSKLDELMAMPKKRMHLSRIRSVLLIKWESFWAKKVSLKML